MEHRSDPRIGAEFDVVLYRHGNPVAACKTRNLSLAGMLVRAGPLAFFRNTRLEVGVRAAARSRSDARLRLSATVVRSSRGGLGLRFDPRDARTRDAVQSLMHGVRSQR